MRMVRAWSSTGLFTCTIAVVFECVWAQMPFSYWNFGFHRTQLCVVWCLFGIVEQCPQEVVLIMETRNDMLFAWFGWEGPCALCTAPSVPDMSNTSRVSHHRNLLGAQYVASPNHQRYGYRDFTDDFFRVLPTQCWNKVLRERRLASFVLP